MAKNQLIKSETPIQEENSSKFKLKDGDAYLKQKLRDAIEDPKKSYSDVLKYIENEIKESTRIVAFNYELKCFFEDGAYALSRAVEQLYGFTSQKDQKAPSGSNPPEMIDVRFADGTRTKVPWGKIELVDLGKDAYIEMGYDYKQQLMFLKGQCEKRWVRLMDAMVEKTKTYVETESIYSGRAIKITDETKSPMFIDLSKVYKTPIFLTPEAKFAVQPIEARIEHTERCVKAGIDLKAGILLEGSYGSGKTLFAFKLAAKAIDNGWTFLYCPKPEKTLYTLEVAKMLSGNSKGIVVFVED